MIYLDNNATTSLDPRVLETMIPLFSGPPCNASSVHGNGQRARGLLSQATQQFASLLGVSPSEIIFTSGATEALNMLLYGLWLKRGKGHVITSTLEHSALLEPLRMLEKRGLAVTYLSPQVGAGSISSDAILEAIRPDTCLIAMMAANNETGIVSDVEGIASLAERHAIPFLVDCVAWAGKGTMNIPKGS